MRLEGKVVLVTGSAQGIGKAIALEFAGEGARGVIVADFNIAEAKKTVVEIEKIGGEAVAVKVNVLFRSEVRKMARKAVDRFGRIDILVNNAGISEIIPFLATTDEVWDKILNVNLRGTFFCCQEVIPFMLKQKQGKIINMSSQSGRQANSWYAAYCASKFGIIGLTQSLALEFASSGINVNAVCPGVVFTSLWDKQLKQYARKYDLKPEKVKEYLIGKIPLGRPAAPEDVAKAALFLASSDSDYLTGQSINVSGGLVLG